LGAYAYWLQTMGCQTKPMPLMLKAKGRRNNLKNKKIKSNEKNKNEPCKHARKIK